MDHNPKETHPLLSSLFDFFYFLFLKIIIIHIVWWWNLDMEPSMTRCSLDETHEINNEV